MGSSSLDDPVKLWLDHAERSLYVLATELRRIPLDAVTKRLHLRALELKRNVGRWRADPPSRETAASTLEEIEALAREAHVHSPIADRTRSTAPTRSVEFTDQDSTQRPLTSWV